MLRAENIRHAYAAKQVLRGIDLHLQASRLLAVTGDNGSGKTTLLKILADVMTPGLGSVVTSHGRAFYMPACSLYDDLTVEENLAFYAGLSGNKPDQALLERFQIAAIASERVRHLSAGQKNRAALCRFFNAPADILILDEPFTALDAMTRQALLDTLTDRKKRGAAIILTTHDKDGWQGAVDSWADMKDGVLHGF